MSTELENKPLDGNYAKLPVVGSVTSIWETMSNNELEAKLIEIENDIESLNTSKSRIENVLFYRKNPECR